MPFFGNGSDIRAIETTIRSIRTKYEKDIEDDLKCVFSLPFFHEYASKGTESKSADKMIVYSFIGTCKTDK
ncbi:MAG: hypothetical protein ABSA79_11870 [Candidatus Bathyarchaeia archaeon]